MLVSDVINLAKSSELRQLAVKDDDVAVLGFINLGLLELYKRFPLKTAEAIIHTKEGKSLYKLNGTDADVEMTEGYTDNLLVIYDCVNDAGIKLSINDEYSDKGIMTPSYNEVQIQDFKEGEDLSVLYQVSPDFIESTTGNIELPPQLLEALLHYIGYRGNSTVSADIKGQNNTHYMRFESSCDRASEKGLIVPDDMESQTFNDRGFV